MFVVVVVVIITIIIIYYFSFDNMLYRGVSFNNILKICVLILVCDLSWMKGILVTKHIMLNNFHKNKNQVEA